MKKWVIFFLTSILACNGRLSDEQKRKIKDEMESSQIKKISEAEITETAFAIGRAIALPLDKRDKQLKNRPVIDSLQRTYSVSIVALTQSDSLLREVEKKIVEAYLAGGAAQLGDNIQKLGTDSLLYTKPMMQTRADGSEELVTVLGIRIPKREVVKKIRE
jgi:predicted NAD-dependent protein-ADP-ribosyltransferase YbiA (DUF1768 family)